MGNSCCGLPNPFHSGDESSLPYKPNKERKMNYYKPTEVTRGVHIQKNPKTGLYEGFPKEWIDNNKINIKVDVSKAVTTSHLSDSIRPNPVLTPKILDRI